MKRLLSSSIDETFDLLESCALAGMRCPTNDMMTKGAVSALARAGRIRVEVFSKNWRTVTILVGENAGQTTKRCPHATTPYLTVDAKGRH